MPRILRKQELAPGIHEFIVHVPDVAAKAKPGHFVIVMADERGERVPLTVADYDRSAGTITLVLMVVGTSSRRLAALAEKSDLYSLTGPLGHPSEIDDFGTVVMVAGGVGTAPVFPIARAMKDRGNRVISIQGARNAHLLFWQDKLAAVSDRHVITTDDGSFGRQALVTGPLGELLQQEGPTIGCVYAIGPAVMMKACAETTRPFGVKTIASLNTIMVDGTGMCGGCRVKVGDKTLFTCVDGPEFDGHLVDWDLVLARQKIYHHDEQCSLERYVEQSRTLDGADPCEPVADTKDKPVAGTKDEPVADTKDKGEKGAARPRTPMPEQDPAVRVKNFLEVPTGYTPELARQEAERCLACKKPFCIDGCPVNVDIPGFIKLVEEGRFAEAARKVKQTNALPAICGRVCPQESQCEAKCVLGKKSESVAVGRLERFVADYERENGLVELPEKAPPTGKRVAVVGSGPAGLTVAGDLVLLGHAVTVFEAFHKPGGVLMYGIPEFRLPKAIVEKEVEYLQRLGVDLELNRVVAKAVDIDELLGEEGYDAVFVGVGAGLPVFLNVPGEDLGGIYSASEYLTRSNLMKAYRFPEYDTPVVHGRHVSVIGGGNVAMDSARTAIRLGAENVSIVYRRSRNELPARQEEVHHAEEEGVNLRLLTNPVAFEGDQRAMVRRMQCIAMELGEPDSSGRRRPVPIPDSEFWMDTDLVIVAVGSGANPLLTKATPGLTLNRWGYIAADSNGRTEKPGVWAGGDIVTGSATVIEAMGAGRIAARDIHEYLCGASERAA